MIRLALLDDHPAVLAGLQRLIGPARDMEVLAAAADEVALARELRGRRPDILIVDYDPARGGRSLAVPPHQVPPRIPARPHLHRLHQPGVGRRRASRAGRRSCRQERARGGTAGRDPPDRGRRDRHAAVSASGFRGGRRSPRGHVICRCSRCFSTARRFPRSPRACEPTKRKAARRAQKIVGALRPRLDDGLVRADVTARSGRDGSRSASARRGRACRASRGRSRDGARPSSWRCAAARRSRRWCALRPRA